jgi:hypothetical protein
VGEPSNNKDQAERAEPPGRSTPDEPKPRIDWQDPNVPIGNAPPLPRWPLVLSGLAWLLWIVLMLVLSLEQHSGRAAIG